MRSHYLKQLSRIAQQLERHRVFLLHQWHADTRMTEACDHLWEAEKRVRILLAEEERNCEGEEG